ncbi:MAG: hypothetical protein GXP55_21435 [Deltaproteobacteria bacterium]|nr:hypothetical protein [Deltaproteobacteria bacterium]
MTITKSRLAAALRSTEKVDLDDLLSWFEGHEELAGDWSVFQAAVGHLASHICNQAIPLAAPPRNWPVPSDYPPGDTQVCAVAMGLLELWSRFADRDSPRGQALEAIREAQSALARVARVLTPVHQVCSEVRSTHEAYPGIFRHSMLPSLSDDIEQGLSAIRSMLDTASSELDDQALSNPRGTLRLRRPMLHLLEAHLHAGGWSYKQIADCVEDGGRSGTLGKDRVKGRARRRREAMQRAKVL